MMTGDQAKCEMLDTQPPAGEWLAIVSGTIGAMFGVGSFSKSGKGLYTPAGLPA